MKIYTIVGIAFALVIAGCSQNESLMNEPEQTQFTHLSIKTTLIDTTSTVTTQTAVNIASALITDKTGESRAMVLPDVTTVKNKEGKTLYYVINYGIDEGFVVVSGDKNQHPVLAYSPMGHIDLSNETTPAMTWINDLHKTESDIKSRPDSVRRRISVEWRTLSGIEVERGLSRSDDDYYTNLSLACAEWRQQGYTIYEVAYNSASSFPTRIASAINSLSIEQKKKSVVIVKDVNKGYWKAPMIKTTWSQGYPYNKAILNLPNINPDSIMYYSVGCVPLSISQILYYHKQPSSKYDFPNMPLTLPLAYPDVPMTLPNFLLNIGQQCGIKYPTTDAGTYALNAKNCLTNNGYNANLTSYKPTSVTSALSNSRPVILLSPNYFPSGNNGLSVGGHAWICDGYNSGTTQTDYSLMVYSGDFSGTGSFSPRATESEYTSGIPYFHMIWGWSEGNGNGYYRTTGNWSLPSGIVSEATDMITDIYYKGL